MDLSLGTYLRGVDEAVVDPHVLVAVDPPNGRGHDAVNPGITEEDQADPDQEESPAGFLRSRQRVSHGRKDDVQHRHCTLHTVTSAHESYTIIVTYS